MCCTTTMGTGKPAAGRRTVRPGHWGLRSRCRSREYRLAMSPCSHASEQASAGLLPERRHGAGFAGTQRANGRNQFRPNDLSRRFEPPRSTGFGKKIGRAARQRFQCGGRSEFRQGTEHDDRRSGMSAAHVRQGRQSVHLGHLDVEDDEIRVELRHLVHRDPSVGRRCRRLQYRTGRRVPP